jgi:hypothetical protein
MNVEVGQIDRKGAAHFGDMTLPPPIYELTIKMEIQKTPPLAMIVCTMCKHMAFSPVDDNECALLLDGGLISRHCHRCRAKTRWQHIEWHCQNWDKPLLYQTVQPDRA